MAHPRCAISIPDTNGAPGGAPLVKITNGVLLMAHHRCAINGHIRCAISRGFSSSALVSPAAAPLVSPAEAVFVSPAPARALELNAPGCTPAGTSPASAPSVSCTPAVGGASTLAELDGITVTKPLGR